MARFIILLSLFLSACGSGATSTTPVPIPSNYGQDPSLRDQGTYIYGNPIAEESTPVVWNGRLVSVLFLRNPKTTYGVQIEDVETRSVIAAFDTPDFCIGSAIVVNGTMYLFGTTGLNADIGNSSLGNRVEMISSTDLINWTAPVTVIQSSSTEGIDNTSVDTDANGFVMVYDVYGTGITSFAQRFARSTDLTNWKPAGAIFSPNDYSAAATIRYVGGYYYLFTTRTIANLNSGYSWYLATLVYRSTDLVNWQTQTAPFAAVSAYGNPSDGIGAADLDLAEYNGQTYVLYSVGNQGVNTTAWQNVNLGVYNGTLAQYAAHFFQ